MVHQRYENVIDLIDEDGSMYDFQKLKDVYEIHGTYLDYLHLINRIPRLWKDLINENSTKMPHIQYNTIQYNTIQYNTISLFSIKHIQMPVAYNNIYTVMRTKTQQ